VSGVRRGRRPTLRAIFLVMAAGAVLYVATLGSYVVFDLAPAAESLRTSAGALAHEYDSLRIQTAALQHGLDEARRLASGRTLAKPEVRALRPQVAAIATQSAGVEASLLLTGIPVGMRAALGDAAGLESRVAGMLLEALEDLDLGDRASATGWIGRAEVVRESLAAQLGDAERLGLVELSDRERILSTRAAHVGQAIAVWVVLGVGLAGIGMLVFHRRVYLPLAQLDRGFARVAQGDFETTLPVRHDDELGRLHTHFNEMTRVLQTEIQLEALRRERFLVDTLMDNVPDSIYFKDTQSRFLRINRAMARRLGIADPAAAVGKTDFDFFAREHAIAALKDEQEILRTGQPVVSMEEMETWPDRPDTWVSTTKMVLRDASGTVTGTFGISRDITDRRRAQRMLEDSEVRFRTAFMTMADAHYIATRDEGRILEVNDRFEDVFGWPRAEAVGRTTLELGLYTNPADRGKMLAELRARGRVRNLEVVGRRKDGETIPILMSVSELPMGEQTLILEVIRDISAEKQAADALKSLEEQFRQAQRLEAVGRLAGGVAHDFNNILTAITGYTELLLDDFRANDPRRTDLEEIRTAAQRAAGLTRQLLAFSRKQVLQPRVLDLNEVVRALERMLHRLIGEDVSLVFTAGADLGAVLADPGQIEQVLLNLAVNARDAMPTGGMLTIETANVELDDAYAREHVDAAPGRYVLLAVSDTGTGMDEETKGHIFEPFFTTKEQGKGTGLGLATVHGIVNQSGGRVVLYSEPGRGTTFKIYLPRVDQAPEVVTAPNGRAAEPAAGQETVLVVEDDRAVREVVAETLAQRGYRVLRAPDGQTALELVHGLQDPVHLLLTDIVMPGMTGRELAQALSAERSQVKVLYMSGYTDDAVVRHGVLARGVPYLQKPFTPDALALKVREVLDRP
jgi:two-component system, cell cycle sensor histidine kinase and response regulator CckA